MKQWKYIKGSEADFEGAPDWALFTVDYKRSAIAFYEGLEPNNKYIDVNGRSGVVPTWGGNFNDVVIIAQRELIEIWDGKGLPPVGIVCQWNNGNEWTTVNVLGVNGNEVWVKPEDGSESFVVNDDDFKPLPDERETAIYEITQIIDHNGVDPLNSAKQIYDAGYRKHCAAPGFEYRLVCQCCGSKVEPGQELYHGCDS